jgi:hypothetical protein
MEHDEFAVRHGLQQCLELRLQHVDVAKSSDSLRKVRDLWQGVHILLDFARDVGIKDALVL